MNLKLIITGILSTGFTTLFAQSNNFTLQQCVDYALQNSAKVQNAAIDEQLAAEKVKEIKGIGLLQAKLSHNLMDNLQIQNAFLKSSSFAGGTTSLYSALGNNVASTHGLLGTIDPNTLTSDQKAAYDQAVATQNNASNILTDAQKQAANTPAIMALPFGVQYSVITQASLTQLIFDGSYLVGLQAANTYKQLASKSTQMSKQEVIQNVHKAYYMVLVNEERKKIFTNNIARLDTILRQTKAMNQAGFVEKIEVSRLEVTYNNILVEKQKFDNLYDLSLELLKLQMGMPSTETITISQKIADFQVGDLGELQVNASNRAEYGLLQTQKRLYELDVKNQKFARLPSVAAFGNLGYNNGSNKFDVYSNKWYNFTNVGLSVNMPIFDGFQKYRKGQQAKLNIQKTENSLAALEKGIAIQSKIAQLQLKNNIQTLNNQKNNVVLAEEVARVTKEKYSKGVGSSLELTSAESELKSAQVNYYEALYSSLISKVELEAALGTLK